LAHIYTADAPAWLREIPAVEILRRIWIQNYVWVEGQLHWRSNEDLPPGKQFINSPPVISALPKRTCNILVLPLR
jgi:transposase